MTETLPPQRRPNLLGIGAAKTGTTWLASVLAAHPDIFMHPQKELNALYYDDLDARLGEYAAYFAGGETHKVRCDFSVRYLNSPNAPAAAARLTPDTKLLLVLRNPVDQVQSHYWHLRRQNFHQATPLDPAPDIFEALERFPHLLLEPALYGKHVRRWLDLFPRERLLILDNAELGADLSGVLSRICAFLEVAPFDFSGAVAQTSAQDGRAGVQPRSGALGRLFPRLYVPVTRGPYMWLKKLFGVQRAEAIKRGLRLRQVSEAVFFKSGYPKLGPSERARLAALFADDLVLLETITPLARQWRAPA